MTLRNRLTLAAAAAVAVAVVAAAAIIYLVVRSELRGDIDQSLENRASQIAREVEERVGNPSSVDRDLLLPGLDSSGTYTHLIFAEGGVVGPPGIRVPFRPSDRAEEVAAGDEDPYLVDVTVGETPVRVLTAPVVPNVAVQVARSLEEVNGTLRTLGLILAGLAAAGVVVAALLGRAVARTALGPVTRLTEATEHVTSTGDLSRRIDASGNDELSRLGASFNAMLEALQKSMDQQRQLVADASHELRTPLTSLRTNVELLERAPEMSDVDRAQLLKDANDQIEELSALVSDLLELARGGEPVVSVDDVRLDELVHAAVQKARRRWPEITFEQSASESVVRGSPERMERAILNLLDNAAKWSPDGGTVEVSVGGSEVTVRDHGPGIDAADLPHIFDRFYRSNSARSTPGSGLGLAIVRQVAEAHGGTIHAENADGGGALFRLQLAAPGFVRDSGHILSSITNKT
jgi:two-component system, OmpR family, sensor histidine kinase MprB